MVTTQQDIDAAIAEVGPGDFPVATKADVAAYWSIKADDFNQDVDSAQRVSRNEAAAKAKAQDQASLRRRLRQMKRPILKLRTKKISPSIVDEESGGGEDDEVEDSSVDRPTGKMSPCLSSPMHAADHTAVAGNGKKRKAPHSGQGTVRAQGAKRTNTAGGPDSASGSGLASGPQDRDDDPGGSSDTIVSWGPATPVGETQGDPDMVRGRDGSVTPDYYDQMTEQEFSDLAYQAFPMEVVSISP
jgi:hypothetical protein